MFISLLIGGAIAAGALLLRANRRRLALERQIDTERAKIESLQTAQAEAMQALEASRVAAEASSRVKDEFLAILGHELRNPLAPIQTALELMRLHPDLPNERERAVIERQTRHLTRL